jgi:predicted amidohydrolase YtcJ
MTTGSGPDLVLLNGAVRTVDDDDREVEAVAVSNGRITAVGTSREIAALRSSRTVEIDLRGRTVVPGLIDSHIHVTDKGTAIAGSVDVRDLALDDIHSIDDVLRRIADAVQTTPPGHWISGIGSPLQNYRIREGRFPHRRELDRVAPDHPVIITFGAHITIANSAALTVAGITRDTPAPKGGAIEHESLSGELTGKLSERAQVPVLNALAESAKAGADPQVIAHRFRTAIAVCLQELHARGVTSIHEIVKTTAAIRALSELARAGELPVRTSLLVRVVEGQIHRETLLNLGAVTGFGNDWLRLGGVKMSIDGGITGKAAAFYEPYLGGAEDDHEHCDCGLIRIPAEELDEIVETYHRAGHRICVHAIGDRAMDMALEAFAKTLHAHPRNDHRHRIEHLGNWMVSPERLARIHELSVLPVPNIVFLYYIYENILAFLGDARLRGSFGLKTLMESGIPLTSGSDGPGYWTGDPLRDMGIAVSRRTRQGNIIGPDEALTVPQALRMVTRNAAYNGFDERVKGSIEPGKLADFAILAENPMLVQPHEIAQIEVDATICDGRVVFERPGVEVRV